MHRPVLSLASQHTALWSQRLRLSRKTPRWQSCLPVLLCVFFHSASHTTVHSQDLHAVLSDAVKAQTVVGAQTLEGSSKRPEVKSINIGFTAPNRREQVTQETMFCIASCSKPLISSVIFTLIEKQQLDLNTPIDRWLPAYKNPKLPDGTLVDPPTLKQLLTHRAGIYSQKENPTADQLRPIRDFGLTLSQSVNLIAQQPLQSAPGSRYAYSGAGYCLIGAIAQKATQQPIDEILNAQICKPLGMSSTTFFPDQQIGNVVATGGVSRTQTPHLLGNRLQLPLVGGSIHTTAQDLQRFARMIANGGVLGDTPILTRASWSQYISQPYETQRYGYGWTRAVHGDEIVLSHNGSLPPAQATMQINLRTGEYKIALWTLAYPRNSETTSRLRSKIRAALNGQ